MWCPVRPVPIDRKLRAACINARIEVMLYVVRGEADTAGRRRWRLEQAAAATWELGIWV